MRGRARAAALAIAAWGAAIPLAAQAGLEREIRAEVARYVAAVNGGDPGRVSALYERSALSSTLGDGQITLGWDRVAAVYADAYRAARAIRMEIPGDSVTVVPLAAGAALAFFPYRWTFGPPGQAVVLRGAMTLLYRRTRDGWRIVHDHTSALGGAPPATAPLPSGGPARPAGRTGPCVVTRVTDGDSLECAGIGRVRLIGIDAPEGDQQPAGDRARDALEQLAPVGARLQLERDVEARDRYGRALAYLWREGTLVNWVMVRQGWALDLTVPPNVRYADAFRDAVRRAREEGAGLWATGGLSCAPARHRRGEC